VLCCVVLNLVAALPGYDKVCPGTNILEESTASIFRETVICVVFGVESPNKTEQRKPVGTSECVLTN
jgi:hypothetical protein